MTTLQNLTLKAFDSLVLCRKSIIILDKTKAKQLQNTKDLFLFTDHRQLSFITYHTKLILFKFNFYNS